MSAAAVGKYLAAREGAYVSHHDHSFLKTEQDESDVVDVLVLVYGESI